MSFDLTDAALRIQGFAVARDWQRFHSLKNLSMALTGEVGELVEILQWKSDGEIDVLLENSDTKKKIEEEVADIAVYVLRIAQQAGIDLADAIGRKIDANESKYPIELAKGKAVKYTEFDK
ncbi:MAG: nucleotide pyrophosphohydrolase [Acidimicrobiales bacterium]